MLSKSTSTARAALASARNRAVCSARLRCVTSMPMPIMRAGWPSSAGKTLPLPGDPVDAAVGPDVAKLDVVAVGLFDRTPDGAVDHLPVVGVDELLEVLERAAERAGGEAVQAVRGCPTT